MSLKVLCLFVCCCVLILCSLNFAKGLTQFSTQNVQNLMNGKKQHLQQVRDALMETSILSVACEKFGNSSSMYATYLSGKSATSKELSEVLTSLEYEVDVVQKLYYEMKSKEDAEAEKKAAELKEAERKAAEKKEADRKEAELKEAERKEAERKAVELKEAERKAAEKKEAERKEAERKEAERKEAELKEAERKEAERKAVELKEAERKAAEKKEAERKEAERKEAERKEAERKAVELKEAERKAAERKEAERKEAERKAAELKAKGYLGDFKVVAAAWGKTNVIDTLTYLIQQQGSFVATSALLGQGGIPNYYHKTLYVVLRNMITGNHYCILLTEGSKFSLSNMYQISLSGTNRMGYKLVGAHYGPKDVTSYVQQPFLSNNPIQVTWTIYTDTWPGIYKTMTVVYVKDNYYYQSIGVEDGVIRIG